MPDLKNGGDFSVTGLKTACLATANPNFPSKTTIASRVIPAGAKAFLQRWSAKVIDVGNADQIYFAILKNGTPIQAGMERIPGIQFDYQSQIDLNVLLTPGLIEIVAYNISGVVNTLEPDAIAGGVTINCQAWWIGNLVSERGGIS